MQPPAGEHMTSQLPLFVQVVSQLPPEQSRMQFPVFWQVVVQPPPSQWKLQLVMPLHWNSQLPSGQVRSQFPIPSQTQGVDDVHAALLFPMWQPLAIRSRPAITKP